MPFSIPNEASAGFPDQAEPDAVDIDILVAGLGGSGVLTGAAVTAQGSPDMTVAVAAGLIVYAHASVVVGAGNVTIGAAHGSNPRFDLITVNNSGTKACTAGTAAAQPVFPAIPASSVVLAAVYIPASDTTIASNQITDKRVILSEDIGPSAIVAKTTTYTANDREIVICTAGSAWTLTLPTSTKGSWVTVKKTDANSNAITVDAPTGNVEGAATFAINVQYDSRDFVCDGTDWWVV